MSEKNTSVADALAKVAALVAFGFFLLVAFFLIGGWAVSVAWGSFVVPVFGLPSIDIGQGISAIILVYMTGWALRGVSQRKATKD